jgi:hypothetical protein
MGNQASTEPTTSENKEKFSMNNAVKFSKEKNIIDITGTEYFAIYQNNQRP